MRTHILRALAGAVLAFLTAPAAASTTFPGGNIVTGVNDHWTTASSPYLVNGDLTVPAGVTLTIDSGVTVTMAAGSDAMGAGNDLTHVEFIVNGTLLVNGTAGS